MNDIISQCRKLYIDAFKDDEEFTDLIFSSLSSSGLEYVTENGKVISMLFCMDVTLDSLKGKYVYGVVTHPDFRGQGRMTQLFNTVFHKYKAEYDFLCLKPMDEGLFDYYSKLGFKRFFKKSKFVYSAENEAVATEIKDVNRIKDIRKKFLKNNYVEYCDVFYKLLYSYCHTYTDDINNPTYLVTSEVLSGRVKEALGNIDKLPEAFCGKEMLTVGNGFDFGMIKFLNNSIAEEGYLGFAMD